MTARFPIALLALTLAFGCSKKKESQPQMTSVERRERIKEYILDAAPEIPNKLDTVFGGNLKLLGYSVDPPTGTYKRGQTVKVTFYWQPTAKVEGGYKLVTNVLDGSGDKLLTIDRNAPLRPNSKDRTSGLDVRFWEPNKVYVDPQTFHVPKTKSDKLQIVASVVKKDGSLPVTTGPKDSSERVVVTSLKVGGSDSSKSPKVPSISIDKLEDKTAKITIDGKLDEPAWETAAAFGPFVDVASGKPNDKSPVGGSAKMLWNDTNLYVAFQVTDASITGGFPKTAKDPHLWTKDTVELMIDPDGDGDNADYYEIQIGPQNLVFDSQYDKYNEPKTEPDGPFGHEDWSSKLKSAVVLDGTLDKAEDTDKGYTVEAAIPWKSFGKAQKSPPALGDTWRMNLYAMQDNSGVAWSPILGQGNFHKASRFGKVRFTAKGWTPEVADAGAPDGAAPAPSASAAVPPSASSVPAAPIPKTIASSLKPPSARPASSAH